MAGERPERSKPRRTAPALDQHAHNWCGACYIVAVVQMIEDRWRVAAPSQARALSVQRTLEDFDARQWARESPRWNACHGGEPRDVVECLRDGRCALRIAAGGEPDFLGRVRRFLRSEAEGGPGATEAAPPIELGPFRVIDAAGASDEIAKRGTVGLLIAASVIASTGPDGKVPRSRPDWPPADHVVCVIGWEAGHWLVRNSWGDWRPDEIPRDYEECNTAYGNTCDSFKTRRWHSLPSPRKGHCLLPMDHPGIGEDAFFAVDVAVRPS